MRICSKMTLCTECNEPAYNSMNKFTVRTNLVFSIDILIERDIWIVSRRLVYYSNKYEYELL